MPSQTRRRQSAGSTQPPASGDHRSAAPTSAVVPMTRQEDELRRMRELASAVDAKRDQLESLLAGQLDVDRFMTVALQAVQSKPELLQCTRLSLLGAIRDAATYGLELAGMLGDASITAYKEIATLSIEYRGLRKLGMRDGTVAAIDADVWYSDDFFDFESGSSPRIVHKPKLPRSENAQIVGAYAWARYSNGELVVLVMSAAEVLKRRDESRSWRYAERDGSNDSIWHKWPVEQFKKTVLRRLILEKLPLTPIAREALQTDVLADLPSQSAGEVAARLAPAGDARQRLLGRLGLDEPAAGADEPAPSQPDSGRAAAAPVEAHADSGGADSAAPGPSVTVTATPVDVELCGALSPYQHEGQEERSTCKKPKGHELVDEPGAKMHRSSLSESWSVE